MRKFLISLLFASAIASPVFAADSYPKVETYELDVRFEPSQAWMEGVANVRFRADEFPLATVKFYLHGELHVDSLLAGGQKMDFTQRSVLYEYDYSLIATEVTVGLSGLRVGDVLTVTYRGYFNPSKARAGSDYMRIDGTGVYLRSYVYSLWFPVFMPPRRDEYPVDFPSVVISTPDDFTAVFLGARRSEGVEGGRRVSHWEARGVSIFDAQCSARRWRVLGDEDVQVCHLPDPDSRERGENILRFAREATAFYRDNYSPGTNAETTFIVQLPEYGDISSGNVSGISDESWREFGGDWVSKYLLAHEIVHPFTGRKISRDDGMWCFVVEGFPSYFHLPFLGESLGKEWYDQRIATVEERYLRKRSTGLSRGGQPLPPEKPIDGIRAEELSSYKDTFVLNDRVVLFFDFLRRRMGGNKFMSMCRVLFEQPRLTTNLIREIIESRYPGPASDIEAWLSTTEFPGWMQVGG